MEVDETYIGGKNKNRHWDKKKPGRGSAGKAIVAGVKDRPTGQVHFEHVPDASGRTLTDLIQRTVEAGAVVYTDEWRGYSKLRRLGYRHSTVKHSAEGSPRRWVDGEAHTNSIESEWALFQRAIVGTYYGISGRHLGRYANEFKGRRNQRPLDTIDQMSAIAKGMDGKRLRYVDLVPPKEPDPELEPVR